MHSDTPGYNPPLQFRPMRLADIPRVHEIDQLSFSLPWPERSFTFELTENPAALAIVAEITSGGSGSELIGMAVIWIIVDEAHIATIAVHPGFRGKGYGKRLLAESLRQSIYKGAVSATLEVRENNQLAQRIYAQFGFTIVGRRERYYRDNDEAAIIMSINGLGDNYLSWMTTLGI